MTSATRAAKHPSRGEAERFVSSLYELRRELRKDRERDATQARLLKGYMQTMDIVSLLDGETGIEARLQERQQSGTLDLVLLAQKYPELVVRLARDGALKADLTTVDSLPYVGELVDFLRPGATSFALVLKAAS